jgi:hypothetical protein
VRVTSEVRFAIIPEWVLYAPISDAAKTLYGLLARIGGSEGDGYVTKAKLGERMDKSPRHIVRLIRELQAIGALTTFQRFGPDNGQRANGFQLKVTPVSGGGDIPVTGPDDITDTQKESPSEREPKHLAPVASGNGHRKRDELFESLIEVSGWDLGNLTPTARGKANSAAKGLRSLNPVPDGDDVRNCAVALADAYPDVIVTPHAIESNFPAFAAGKLVARRRSRR